ncbi:farnesyl diphosphate synthase [Lentibacillus kapialis]|uniref:Farnesyl diphosphate synthase n=1 Tax=Lentibacillus kapialis TaxID=340214 RepID=A0A917PZI1_9BACI|nr:farnesyl diphosphate synthase [Lentibacillus kapialis]GGK02789.1 farnesyl diphosphate synthase [Lentibacillus kapialis]
MIVQQKLNSFININREKIQQALTHHLQQLDIPDQLKDSMIYSAEAGGKRLRPILLMASFHAYSNDDSKVLSLAVALELIHTYSLIHDDLPAMDDDNVRRGLPTNHIKFDEATAILAGDALLTFSFELIARDSHLTDEQKAQLTRLLAEASGPKGMVAGQILDMEAERKAVTLEELETIHTLKTGELFRFAIRSGAYLGGATREQIAHLDKFAHFLGLIFQVQDDILDVTGDAEKIGKPIGSDEVNEKNTYVKLLGVDGAVEKKEYYVNRAKKELSGANADASYLTALVDYFSKRDH